MPNPKHNADTALILILGIALLSAATMPPALAIILWKAAL